MANVVTPIKYNTTSGFTFDNTKVQITAGSASLIAAAGVYPTSNPTIIESQVMQASALQSFVENASYSGSDNVQYTIVIGGLDYYWSGSAWVSSSGAYAQSNTASTINANCTHSSMASLLTGGAKVQIRAFLHSASGTTTPILTSVSLGYTYAAITPTNPSLCVVYAYLQDILGNTIGSVQNAQLSVMQKDPFIYGSFVIAPYVKSVSFNSSGYAQIVLVETQTPGISVLFSVSYQINDTIKQINLVPCQIPNSGSASLTSITTFANQSLVVPNIGLPGQQQSIPAEQQLTISNNQASTPLVTIQFGSNLFSQIEIKYSLKRSDTGEFFREDGRLYLDWNSTANTWAITKIADSGSSGPLTGVDYSISTGPSPSYLPTVSYTSDNMTGGGTYVGTWRYKIFNTFLKET